MRRALSFVVSAVLLAACGGVEQGGSTDPTDGTESTAEAEATAVRYLVPNPAMTLGHVYAPVAEAAGFYDEAGIGVTIDFATGTPAAIQALATGSADMAMIDTASLDAAVAEGITNVRAACTVLASNIYSVAVLESSGVTDVAELAGTQIGIPNVGTGTHINAQAVVREAGLDPEADVEFVPIEAPAAQLASLTDGTISALGTFDSFVGTFRAQGAELQLFQSEDLQYQWSFFGASDEFISEHPDAVAAMCRATLQAEAYTVACPAAALAAYREQGYEAPEDDAAAIETINARAEPSFRAPAEGGGKWGWVPVDSMDELAKTYVDLGVLSESLPVADYYTNEFLDEIQFDEEAVSTQARSDGGC